MTQAHYTMAGHEFALLRGTDEWLTPPEIVTVLDALGGVALDPCSAVGSLVGAEYELVFPEFDGLAEHWHEIAGITFVNPPYSQLAAWLAKCVEEAKKGATPIVLCPGRIETRAFAEHVFGHEHSRMLAVSSRLSYLRSRDSLEREVFAAEKAGDRVRIGKTRTQLSKWLRKHGDAATIGTLDSSTFPSVVLHWTEDRDIANDIESAFAHLGTWLRKAA